MRTVYISKTNHKLRGIPSVSLRPILDCGADVPCGRDCYACRMYRYAVAAPRTWARNSAIARADAAAYFASIRGYLAWKNPALFRWHVAGDILDQTYLDSMIAIARDHQGTRFMCYTKRHELDFTALPANLSILASMWPGWGNEQAPNIRQLPKAWMDDGTETRIPASAIRCPGQCDTCGLCWSPLLSKDVVFHKH